MGQLNLLGAQRVKALQEIAKKKCNQELAEVEKTRLNGSERYLEASKLIGEENLYAEFLKAKEIMGEFSARLESTFGIHVSVSMQTHRINTDFQRALKAVDTDYLKNVSVIKDKWLDIQNKLWLCETLEEAKELVGVE